VHVYLSMSLSLIDGFISTHARGGTCVDYQWNLLASPVIDVGGGVGSLELSLAKYERYNHLEFVIFDIPKTIAQAEKVFPSFSAVLTPIFSPLF